MFSLEHDQVVLRNHFSIFQVSWDSRLLQNIMNSQSCRHGIHWTIEN